MKLERTGIDCPTLPAVLANSVDLMKTLFDFAGHPRDNGSKDSNAISEHPPGWNFRYARSPPAKRRSDYNRLIWIQFRTMLRCRKKKTRSQFSVRRQIGHKRNKFFLRERVEISRDARRHQDVAYRTTELADILGGNSAGYRQRRLGTDHRPY